MTEETPVAWTGSGSMMALQDGREGFIWPTAAEAHPIPLYTRPSAPPAVSDEALVERIGFTLWKAEAERAAPNVAKNRTLDAFRNDTDESDRMRWILQARAILPIIRSI